MTLTLDGRSMFTQPSSGILLLGLGNDFRGDDGVGRVVARRLAQTEWPGVTVREESGEGVTLMEAWKYADSVILVDAVQSGDAPGTIHRLDARAQSIPANFFHYSTHAFSVAEAVELARALNQLPPRLILYGIEGRDFSDGERISPEVAAAMDELLGRVRQEIQSILANFNH
ncbi:MAG: hydrogenase maturation protease [Verrucomicrobiales bacterium]|nr:hydrogenase maturation protease [Verrucomicrobiales bacterium]